MWKFLVPGLVILAALVLFVINNLSRPSVIGYETARPVSALSDADLKKSQRRAPEAGRATPADEMTEPIPPLKRSEFTLAPVVCPVADSAGHRLLLGIKLVYEKGPLDREIRLKEKNIAQLMKFVLSDKAPSSIEASVIRRELKERINAFLTSGKVRDVVFTSFDIIPRAAP
jgi:flagellar basal body-associated protein FliL